MSKKIWKFENEVGSITTTPHLNDSPVIHVAPDPLRRPLVSFWIEWDDSDPTQRLPRDERQFAVFATGAPIPENYRYCGTAVFTDSGFVWHLYELL